MKTGSLFARSCLTCATLSVLQMLLFTLPLQAAPLQSHKSIRDAAVAHVVEKMAETEGEVEVIAGQLDSRLRLARCQQPLETYDANSSRNLSRQSVGVRCGGEKPWSLYIPVKVSITREILVAAEALSKGDTIEPQDLQSEPRDIARLHQGYLLDRNRVIGKVLKRRLRAGAVLSPRHLEDAQQIKRGNRVTILANTGSIQVRMQGKALSNGARGERIRVLNESSKREIEAQVIAPGLVEVTL